MTSINISRSGSRYDIRIEGHADYNPGLDIVCSAVSMLSFTLMQALRNEDEDGNMALCDIRYSSGDVHISVTPVDGCCERIMTIIDTITIGFELLSNQYPENVELNC